MVQLLAVAVALLAQTMQSPVPKALPFALSSLAVRSDNGGTVRVGTTNGYSVTIYDKHLSGVSPEALLSCIPDVNEIPGFVASGNQFNSVHTSLDLTESLGRVHRNFVAEGAESFPRIEVSVDVFPDAAAASRNVDEILNGPAQLRIGSRKKVADAQLPHGRPIGDAYWVDFLPGNRANLLVRQGRAVFEVRTARFDGDALPVTEAIARLVQYSLVSQPGLAQKEAGTTLNGLTVSAAGSLATPRVSVSIEVQSGQRVAVLRSGGQVLRLQAWQRMGTLNGHEVPLDMTPFPHGSDLIVPRNQVRKLLGL